MASVHVVAAAVFNAEGDVLIARRPPHVHQGGLWEFPGGKLEPGETPREALARELEEELGIEVQQARPLIQVQYDYPDKSVFLDVWQVDRFRGTPHGREGQPVEWLPREALTSRAFPAANAPIVTAARLPDTYLITPEPRDEAAFLEHLEARLAGGIRLVQLRAKTLTEDAYRKLAAEALTLARRQHAILLLNAAPELARALDADGVHLTSARLMALEQRPLPKDKWVAASCHNEEELSHANAIGVDFVVLSPVLATPSHPGAATLGWEGLKRLCRQAQVPAYGLGGLGLEHRDQAFASGAQGVAGISALW